MKVLSFGEILWDVYPNEKYLGGAPLNFAAHLAKHGEDVAMLSAVGQDVPGKEAKEQVSAWGISTEYIAELSDKQTGCCLVTLNEQKVPGYNLLQDVAYDYIPCPKGEESFDVLYFGTLSLRSAYNCNSLADLLNKSFREVFVDVNIRPPYYSRETVRFAASKASILKVSDEELSTVAELLDMEEKQDYQKFARDLSDQFSNLRCIIITLGSKGAFALGCREKEAYSVPCAKVTVKSTVGAGDSFSAAFLHKFMAGKSIADCLNYAAKVAGFVVSHYEAVPEYGVGDLN